jgi:chaperonin cofactor prefoldin
MKHFAKKITKKAKKLVNKIFEEVDSYMSATKEVELAKINLVRDGVKALATDKRIAKNVGTVIIGVGLGCCCIGGSLIVPSFLN